MQALLSFLFILIHVLTFGGEAMSVLQQKQQQKQQSRILAGQTVLVTGAGRGIGRAIAHICAQQGAQVAICSRTKSDLEETVATCLDVVEGSTSSIECEYSSSPCRSRMDTYVADVTKENEVEAMITSIVEKWGSIDILINNAGKGQSKKAPVQELTSSDLKDLFDINVASIHSVTSAVLRHSMLLPNRNNNKKSNLDQATQPLYRRIINVSSKAAKIGIGNNSFYVATKFALEGYSASLAQELKEHNILVNTISPGMVNTQSFPKPPGRKGVRTAESIRDGLLVLLQTNATGHYLHVDELDLVRAKEDLDDSLALKPINEVPFSV